MLTQRAELLAKVWRFFSERGFTEVGTPTALDEVIPERHIEPVRTDDGRFLQASPELAMKRLLCLGGRGSGRAKVLKARQEPQPPEPIRAPIFQIAKAFRGDEQGPLHRPEFTMLEWYRPGDDMAAGIALLDELVQTVLGTPPCRRSSYREIFWRTVGVDPLNATSQMLAQVAKEQDLNLSYPEEVERDEWLNLLLAAIIEKTLGIETPEIVYHYPATQAALAKTTTDVAGIEVAERFELYYQGIELANGYHELTDAAELRSRLEQVNIERIADNRPALPMPESLLAAMASPGMPACAGVALGFDRLLMLAVGAKSIGEVT